MKRKIEFKTNKEFTDFLVHVVSCADYDIGKEYVKATAEEPEFLFANREALNHAAISYLIENGHVKP